MTTKPEKNYSFIDAQNLHLGAIDAGIPLDYGKLRVYLKEKYAVERAYLFIGYLPQNVELYSKLQEQGYLLKFKPVLPAKNGQKQKGDVDAHLAFNAMKYYREYDGAILVTSDGDYDTMAKYLRKKGKLEAVISPNRENCSSLLQIAAAEKMQYLEDVGEKIHILPGDELDENEKTPPEDGTSSSASS